MSAVIRGIKPMGDPYPLALVTGAAHRLGKAIAMELARNGYAIGIHFHHSQSEAEAAAREIEALGAPAILLPADLKNPQQIIDLFNHIPTGEYQLKVLVNSASVMLQKSLTDLSIPEWDNTMNLNLRAPWLCSMEAVKLMGNAKGVIINITDSGTRQVWSNYAAYLISKSGLETLTRLLARTLAPSVRVNGIAPGLILPSEHIDPEKWQSLVDRLPLKTSGTPEQIASAVLHLITNEYITGETLVVDGGYQLI
jgi:NAD(P)-dependent dehydrogenase (short-subunit alcohol dehydrogenase family)